MKPNKKVLKAVANDLRKQAHDIREEDAYAPHVSEKTKDDDLAARLQEADEVEAGMHLNNYSVCQMIKHKQKFEAGKK